MGKFIPVEPEKWAEMVKAQAENARLKAEVEAQAKRWAESEDLISHYKEQREEVINNCQCSRLKAEVERLTEAGDLMCRMAGNNQVINRHWKTAKGVQS